MINAIRQYRHNDSDDFLIGYDCEAVNKVYEAMNKRITELEKVELETVTKTRKMFVANARKFGYSNSVGHTIQELQKWEQKLKEQGE
jgi:hypothetical protein